MKGMSLYTDQERDTIRTAAFGAITLISTADPGFLATFKETMAGAKALASATGDLQTVLKSGGIPPVPKGSRDEMKAGVLSAVRESTQIISAKSPQDLEPFRNVIVAACEQVAAASKDVTGTERAAINEVKAAAGIS